MELKKRKLVLPLTSHIHVAVSGGSDSVALALLVSRYGRKIAAPNQITLLHINHGWRGTESDADEVFVKGLARKLGVQFSSTKLASLPPKGESWEKHARSLRKAIFTNAAQSAHSVVLTAHTKDDVAETVLWRICTGKARTHGEGIRFRHGVEVRPFLWIRKSEIQAFLKEEGQKWREDQTNHEGRFLRSRIRRDVMPPLAALFPRVVDHLADFGADR